MFAAVLIIAFAAAIVATAIVLADSGLRLWSAFGAVRRRMKTGYASNLPEQRSYAAFPNRPHKGVRQSLPYPVIRGTRQHAA